MAIFTPGTPIETTTPFIPVEGLPPGSHTFRLVVEDESGNQSLPAFAKVEINRARGGLVDPRVLTVEKVAGPVDADHDPAGRELWVSGNGPVLATAGTSFVTAISLPEGRIVATMQVPPRAGDIAVSRSAERRVGLLANPGSRSATLLSLSERSILNIFRLKDDPDGVAVSPDGTRGVAAIPNAGQVVVLDLVDFRVLAEIQVGQVGRLPSKVRIAQEGRIAFVNCLGSGNIVGIDLRRFTVVGSLAVGGSPSSAPVQFTLTKEGFPVWTANQGAGSASNALSATRINDIPLDFKPGAVASDEAGKRGYVVGPDSDRLAYIETESPEAKFVGMPAPGGGYRSVAATRDGGLVAVVHPLKESASFYIGPELQLRAIVNRLPGPARVLATDDDSFFGILDPRGNSVSLVDISTLA